MVFGHDFLFFTNCAELEKPIEYTASVEMILVGFDGDGCVNISRPWLSSFQASLGRPG